MSTSRTGSVRSLTTRDVADAVGVGITTVLRWVRRGHPRAKRSFGIPGSQVIEDDDPRGAVRTGRSERRHHALLLPSPAALDEYNAVAPGAADRFLLMFERQQQHHMELELKALSGQIRSEARGARYGLVVALFFGAVALLLASMGYPSQGLILGTVDIVSLVGVFVYGRHQQVRDRELRRREIEDSSSTEHAEEAWRSASFAPR